MTVMRNETLETHCKLAKTLETYQYYWVDISRETSVCPYVIRSFD